ncbi:MAG: phosphoheptose isomerase [Gammaproteobacteria bacterium]|nr:MAG: phosphoheptose isomerase [Gammaproteobacteria bacterium]
MRKIFEESLSVKQATVDSNLDLMIQAVDMITASLEQKGKILFFGNGGSAADAQHIAAEFIGRFMKERKALAAIALTTDSSVLTCLGNDYSYEIIFSRQIEALGNEQDIAFGLSTSGNSKNVIKGIQQAKQQGMKTIVMTGCGGGELKGMADINLDVPSNSTARIQEAHMCIYHTICELVENNFAG